MFLKIMQLKDSPDKRPDQENPDKIHFSTHLIDCKKVVFYEDIHDGVKFTIFTTDPGRETERSFRVNEDENEFHNVYIMNNEGKTIQKPI